MSYDWNTIPEGRKIDIHIAKILGYQVVETDDCNGVDNLWLSENGRLPATTEDGFDMELPTFSSSDEEALYLLAHMAEVNEKNRCGPLLELSHDGQWHFRIGNVQKVGSQICSVVCSAVLEYFEERVLS